MKDETIIFPNSKRYKGDIVFKKRVKNGKYMVVKHSTGGHNYEVTKDEYEWITDKNKALQIYAYKHFGVNASCNIKHPFTGKTALETFRENKDKSQIAFQESGVTDNNN